VPASLPTDVAVRQPSRLTNCLKPVRTRATSTSLASIPLNAGGAWAASLPGPTVRRKGRAISGERDLQKLLASLQAHQQPGHYVFTVAPRDLDLAGIQPVVTVVEAEGLTLVLGQGQADRLGLRYDYIAAWLTLRVHSSLGAVGLTATVSGRLAEAGISCNVVAGYHHDHLFVPAERADHALAVLEELSARARTGTFQS
jgi:hypothetical protein